MKKIQIVICVIMLLAISSSQAGWYESFSTYLCSKKNQQSSLFERGTGFWSSPANETSTSFFGKLTEPKSQRENWYKVSPYIAEFWCALSNAGFLYVGIKEKSPELLFAGLASFASHSIPKQWLLYVDKLGVLVALSKVIREFKELKKNPKLIFPVLALGAVNVTDLYLAREKGQTWPHVAWHLSAAFVSSYLLKSIKPQN